MNGKLLGSALVGAMMVGCAGNATGADPAQLDAVSAVSPSIDGRTDLFLDPTLSRHLLTADEVNGSPTAVAVEVQITETELIAWRAQPTISAADRTRTEADIVARFDIVGTTDLSTAEVIGDTTHPTQPGATVNIPGGGVGGHLGNVGSSTGSHQPLPHTHPSPVPGSFLNVDWSSHGGIPGSLDVSTYHNIATAHPGCA